jgi:hypothetical protein
MISATAQKRAEREARDAEIKRRFAEIDRLSRNAEAGKPNSAKTAADLRERELSKLIAALGMLGSEHAGERAAAALHVERLRTKLGKQWRDLILG